MTHKRKKKKEREKGRWRKDNKQSDISGVLMGTLCVSCLFCGAVFHYFWVHKISTLGRKERNKREKVARPQGGCWFGERNKRIIPFDVRNKSSPLRSSDGGMSANGAVIGVVISVEVKAKWKIGPEFGVKKDTTPIITAADLIQKMRAVKNKGWEIIKPKCTVLFKRAGLHYNTNLDITALLRDFFEHYPACEWVTVYNKANTS